MADSSIAVINLGSQRVGGAVFGRTPGGDLILKRYAFVEMDGDPSVDVSRLPQLKVALGELVNRLKIRGKKTWCAVPGHPVFSRFVKLPPVQGDKLAQIVEFEARQNVPWQLDEVSWDYEVVTKSDLGEVEVVLAAMKCEPLNEMHEEVASSGVSVVGMDVGPLALYNAFRYSYPDVDEPALVVDLGARSTNLVFVDGDKFFTRNLLVGGAAVTNAIGKEFGVQFTEAERQKCLQGFVALGGAVEDHPDEGVNAMSKVMRNSMTRLHAEIMRTITFYRSQQGGSAPKRMFVAGGGSAAGYIAEFFTEKLKLPVEVFNGLRGVQLDRSVNAEAAQVDAPSLGELSGLALRGMGSCPCEIELVPDALASARDAARRAPALILAGLCIMGALGAAIFWFKSADAAIQNRSSSLQAESGRLTKLATDIRQLDQRQEELRVRSGQLEQAVTDRSWWARLLNELNQRFDNDLIWLTTIEPLKDGKPLTAPLWGGGNEERSKDDTSKSGARPAAPVYSLKIQGLYRGNAEGEQKVVYDFAAKVAKMADFAVPDFETKRDEYVKVDSGVEEDRYAYHFEIKMPLSKPLQFK
ncbi:MAG: type IV pilus assembly protein PilM [Prosthecobacter sp.]|jgi:type IV pilus assembly protein PilM|uniref:Amuc_1101 family PilM-like pilus complex protein n=1 Tax=Prosthecobacter sp. TaxID=1965333 RepID=UPI001A05CBC4|nr:type IV pilus assembly protein PilM [Prosthecobacter sp.]MBE2284850.1 type IV pilus assembly protein PilM [Prosthecobacter sp.]